MIFKYFKLWKYFNISKKQQIIFTILGLYNIYLAEPSTSDDSVFSPIDYDALAKELFKDDEPEEVAQVKKYSNYGSTQKVKPEKCAVSANSQPQASPDAENKNKLAQEQVANAYKDRKINEKNSSLSNSCFSTNHQEQEIQAALNQAIKTHEAQKLQQEQTGVVTEKCAFRVKEKERANMEKWDISTQQSESSGYYANSQIDYYQAPVSNVQNSQSQQQGQYYQQPQQGQGYQQPQQTQAYQQPQQTQAYQQPQQTQAYQQSQQVQHQTGYIPEIQYNQQPAQSQYGSTQQTQSSNEPSRLSLNYAQENNPYVLTGTQDQTITY